MAKMKEDELLAILKIESDNSIGAGDETTQQRAKMLSYYMGEAEHELSPPEVEGRSKVVSKDMMDTVEWMMPTLMGMFARSDDAIKFLPESEDEASAVKDASNYVAYLFWRKNPGFRVLHDAIKNALIQRQSYVEVYCDEPSEEREERYEGISGMEVQSLEQDPDVKIVEVEPYGMVEASPDQQAQGIQVDMAYTVTVKRTEKQKFKRVCGVPPEEMRYSKDAMTIELARFVEKRTKKTASDLISLGYPKDKVEALPSDDDDVSYERMTRHSFDSSVADYDSPRTDPAMREVLLCTSYVKVDFDGDGVAEFRRVVHASGVIFENKVVDDHPFAQFTPILMPYKSVGLGMWDLCEDIMRIRTVLTRQMLDNAYQTNMPQRVVAEGQVHLDDLLNQRANGVIRVKTGYSIDAAMRTDQVPFIGPQALTMLDHFGKVRDQRTGVVSGGTSLNPEALQKTEIGSEGAEKMMDAAMQRVELIARVFAETGLARVWQLLLKLATQYPDRSEQMEINGQWMTINPREWKNKYDTAVSIGTGTTNSRQKIGNLQTIIAMQEKAGQFGLSTPENAYAALSSMVEAMGWRNSDRFFTNPKNAPPPPDPGPPPEVLLEQEKQKGQQQLAQVKAQADIEVARMEQEYQAQESDRSKQMEADRDRQQSEQTIFIEQVKAEKQAEIEAMKIKADLEKARIQQETAIAVARINAEAKMIHSPMESPHA